MGGWLRDAYLVDGMGGIGEVDGRVLVVGGVEGLGGFLVLSVGP